MKKYKYSWSRKYKADPQVAGEIFQRLGNDDAVLKEAREPASPLHGDFDWDDSSAAREYRLHQVRIMRNCLVVEVVTKERETIRIHGFVSKGRDVFVPTLEASVEELSFAEARVFSQLVSLKAKLKGYRWARTVVEAIADVEKSVSKGAVRVKK